MINRLDKKFMLLYFVPLLVVGVIGNVWVIASVLRILHNKQHYPLNRVFKHLSLYILVLSCADLCVLCTIPMLMSYFLDGNWHFGYLGCKLFFVVENVNKLLSVAILAVMSFERFLAISRPFELICCRSKRVSNVVMVVTALLIAIICLCAPMIYYAETTTTTIGPYNDGAAEESSLGHVIVICGSNLPDEWMSFFIAYMFLLGFVLPITFIGICYFFLIRHLRLNSERSMFSSDYTHKVVKSVLRVALFHLFCWAPFWIFVLLPMLSYFGLVELTFLESHLAQTMRMVSSFLPYLNSAGNWLFYAAMNRELRDAAIGKMPKLFASHACARLLSNKKPGSESFGNRRGPPQKQLSDTALIRGNGRIAKTPITACNSVV